MTNYALIFDTETTSLAQPFCYDIGYCIIDMNSGLIVKQEHFIIEQIWHNFPLFESAYYKEKRPEYIKLMRAKKAILEKWGYACQTMARDIKNFQITDVYAYNSQFDDNVFNFNSEWYHTINPIENVAIHDIWGYASQFITFQNDYKIFCEINNLFNESGNYKGSAESVYQFISNNPNFIEKHMGLYDSQIEAEILLFAISNCGAEWAQDYPVTKILKREVAKPFTIKIDGKILYQGEYYKKIVKKDQFLFRTEV